MEIFKRDFVSFTAFSSTDRRRIIEIPSEQRKSCRTSNLIRQNLHGEIYVQNDFSELFNK